MSDDDQRDDDPKPLDDITSFFAARAAEAETHATTCKAPFCPRCGRLRCKVCGNAFGSDRGSEEHCDGCRTAAYRREWVTPALSLIPRDYTDATLDQEWLSRLVGSQNISEARKALSAPRVALTGLPGAGKTSLAIAMFQAAVIADAPTAPRTWRYGVFPRPFGATHLYVSAFALAKARGNAPIGSEAPLVERALGAPLVVIDELGGEDPRYASAVAEVIYERHGNGLATWITTGVDAPKVASRYGGGIARKAFEDAVEFKLVRKL